MLGNLAGAPGRQGIEAIKDAGAIPVRGRTTSWAAAVTSVCGEVNGHRHSPAHPHAPTRCPKVLMSLLKNRPFHVRKEARGGAGDCLLCSCPIPPQGA